MEGMGGGPGITVMPLTEFQRLVLAALVANRSEASHFAMKEHWMELSDHAEAEMIRLADTRLDMPIGVAFVDGQGNPGWIGNNPDLRIHHPSLRGCWPVIHE